MPSAPRIEDMDAITRRGMCFTDFRIVEAVAFEFTSGLESRVWMEVNVPGNITKPARRIH